MNKEIQEFIIVGFGMLRFCVIFAIVLYTFSPVITLDEFQNDGGGLFWAIAVSVVSVMIFITTTPKKYIVDLMQRQSTGQIQKEPEND